MDAQKTQTPNHDEEELVLFLEPDQLVADRRRPLPRAKLSPRLTAFLLFARIAVTVFAGLAIYTFAAQLH
jgi:hypothetical protein